MSHRLSLSEIQFIADFAAIDWPKLASDADLLRLSKGQMAFGRAKL